MFAFMAQACSSAMRAATQPVEPDAPTGGMPLEAGGSSDSSPVMLRNWNEWHDNNETFRPVELPGEVSASAAALLLLSTQMGEATEATSSRNEDLSIRRAAGSGGGSLSDFTTPPPTRSASASPEDDASRMTPQHWFKNNGVGTAAGDMRLEPYPHDGVRNSGDSSCGCWEPAWDPEGSSSRKRCSSTPAAELAALAVDTDVPLESEDHLGDSGVVTIARLMNSKRCQVAEREEQVLARNKRGLGQRKEWTEEEDGIIIESITSLGYRWRQIASLLPGRSDDAVRNRWNRLREQLHELRVRPSDRSSPTSKAGHAFSAPTDSAAGTAESRKSHSEKAPRHGWTADEDLIIEKSVGEFGHKWLQIAGRLNNRTHHAIRNRWFRLQSMRNDTAARSVTAGVLSR